MTKTTTAKPNEPAEQKRKRHPRLKRVSESDLPGFALTERDMSIVQAVWDYRALTTEQIEELFFPQTFVKGKKQTNSNCQTRLRHLYHRGLLLRTELPPTLGEGRKPLVYWLDRAGAELLAIHHGVEFSEIGWRPNAHKVGLQFLYHLLDSNTVRVKVTRSAQRHGFVLAEWRTEEMLRADHATDIVTIKSPQGTTQQATVIPDEYFVLEVPTTAEEKPLTYRHFVEVDRRTVTGQAKEWNEGRHDWAKKIATYLAYIRSGKYEARYGTMHGRILTITTGAKRLANLKRITEDMGGKSRFWFSTLAAIKTADILTDSVWQVATRDGVYALIDAHQKE